MRYKVEIFDYIQHLYETTGYNDHQLHFIIRFKDKVQPSVLKRATELLVEAVPILSRGCRNDRGLLYWEDGNGQNTDLFTIINNADDFNAFILSKTDEQNGPQIKVCLLQAESDSLAILVSHMVTDGAGMKRCVNLLAEIYSKLLASPDYCPDYVIDGNRGFKKIISGVRLMDRIKILLFQRKENNQDSGVVFPMSSGAETSPFFLTHEISSRQFSAIKTYCKSNHVTVNDVLLTTYFRALSGILKLNGDKLSIPFMIDMRKYAAGSCEDALTNLSSTAILSAAITPKESFQETLKRISADMAEKKSSYLGINTFLKLNVGLLRSKLGYRILERSLKNPKIGITNIGIIDEERLRFEGSTVEHAYIFGSVKYRPYFQMAASTYKEAMTFCVALYGDAQDKITVSQFFECMDKELISVIPTDSHL